MARKVVTPVQATAAPVCEGFIVGAGDAHASRRRALELARNAVNETLPGRWEVTPLSGEGRDFEVRRRSRSQKIPMPSAWKLCRRLEAHRDLFSAEPELILPGIHPGPSQIWTKEEPHAKSARPGRDLPCSRKCQWSLAATGVLPAWQLALPDPSAGKHYGEGIVVGHPDTGYTDHPEIIDGGRLLIHRGYDFEDDDRVPLDPLVGWNPGHGTSTASVIMSDIGPAGAAPFVSGAAPRAKLVPIRVSTSVVHLSFGNLAKAIYFAADHGHHVLSMSLGGPLRFRYLHRAIRYAVERGVILLAAAGNYWPWVVYPAKFDEVVAVAAGDCRRKIWPHSAAGRAVDVTAPGESVWRARSDPDAFSVDRSSGTSYAVALVAGVCALWLAHHGRERLTRRYQRPGLAAVFKELLIEAGVDTPAGWDRNLYGAGIVNAVKLLEAPLPDRPPASGMKAIHAGAAPLVRTGRAELDEFLDYFPGVNANRLQRTITRLLCADASTIGGRLAEFGEELLFHIATNPGVRAAIAGEATGRVSKARAAGPLLAANKRLKRQASSALMRLLSG